MTELARSLRTNLGEIYSPRAPQYVIWISIALMAAVAIGLYSLGRAKYALLMPAAIVVFWLVCSPRVTFYLFLAALGIYMPQRITSTFAIHAFDILMLILFMGMATDFLLRRRTEIRSTPFDWPFVVLIVATIVSAVFAHDPRYSVVPMLRIVVIYLAFRAVFKFALEIGVRRILLFYVGLVSALALYNIGLFIILGGQVRIFGLASLGFETLAMTAVTIALALMIWSERRWEKAALASASLAIGLAIFASQSRAPLVAIIISVPILVLLARTKARRENARQPLKTIKSIFVPFVLLAAIFVMFQGDFFAGALGRYQSFVESFSDPKGTVALRLIQWSTAWKTFLDHSLTGIGIGNFRIVHDIYPDIRTVPLYYKVKGMSAHNVVLHYLAETGLIGSLALVSLVWAGLRSAHRTYRTKWTYSDCGTAVALYTCMILIAVTFLYMRAWTWGQGGYVMAVLFGLTAALHHQIGDDPDRIPRSIE